MANPLYTSNNVTVQSFGAAETVTGSKHLLRTPEKVILVDCGLFQGLKELRLRNWDKLPVNAADIEVMILTHAHLDHCGYIPLLVKNGFKGKIYMSPPTRDLAEVILRDSAKIQEEDAEKANRGKYSKHDPALPLYTLQDAEKSFAQFEGVEEDVVIQLSANISFQFKHVGHILGACLAEIKCFGKTLVFTGDVGRPQSSFLAPPGQLPAADFVFMESTYGDRLHGDQDVAAQLEQIVNDTIKKGGDVLIPSFAVGRAQEVAEILAELKTAKRIPEDLAVYVDSPMAADATDILLRYPKWHKLTKDQCYALRKDTVINRDFKGTQKIIANPQPKVVLAASGMLTGGRVLEYLKRYAGRDKDAILLIGYQAEGTRGRALLGGSRILKMYGQQIEIKATIHDLSGLSAHGDQGELLDWLKNAGGKPGKIFLVHGELPTMNIFQQKIKEVLGIDVQIMPAKGEVELFKVK